MNRDRIIQLVCVLICVCALLGATMLVPVINKQRRDGQLSFDLEVGDRTRVKYALAAAALGTFRGIVADVAWYRAERLKQAGKFFEANSLAQWITTLQPRFPQVWAFHAWNLAYNISVQTHTPQERWDWVHSGIRLLREQGIPSNPNAVRLYRELGWIFFHKFGKTSDDMHWYYKRMHAREWQELLGAPTEGATTEQTIARFKPVADAADQYFAFHRLPYAAYDWIDAFVADNGLVAAELLPLKTATLRRADDQLAAIEHRWQAEDSQLAEQLEPLRKMVNQHREKSESEQDKLQRFYADVPVARSVGESLRDLGLLLDVDTLRRIGTHQMRVLYSHPEAVRQWVEQAADATDQKLIEMILDSSRQEGFTAMLGFLRAKVLFEHYRMDAGVMYALMSGVAMRAPDNPGTDLNESELTPLPIDWRHPAAHGIYWAYLGVHKAGELLNQNKIDFINTDRQVIHGMQELMFFGRVSFNPYTGEVDLLPDPRFIEGYEKAVFGSTAAIEQADITQTQGTVSNYEAGHENFLAKAALFTYLYGDMEQSEGYYRRLGKLYGDKPHNVIRGSYRLPLAQFVLDELKNEMDRSVVARSFIEAMALSGITQGLALGRVQVFERFVLVARQAHERFQSDKIANPTAVQDRQKLLTFKRTLDETYINYMRSPAATLLVRGRAYRHTPVELRHRTYHRFLDAISKQCQQAGYDVDRAFPPPPGYVPSEPEANASGDQGTSTIEQN